MNRVAAPDPRCPECGEPRPVGESFCPQCAPTQDGEPAAFTGPKQIGAYRILRELGAGGMGTVFEAYQETMGRNVALKVLSRHHAPSDDAAQRFVQEAWIAGRLQHPNLVQVYERGTWEELSYYSMELVDGGSLAQVVDNMKRWGRDDRLGLEFGSTEYVNWAIRQVVAAARALDHAHSHGVVHRDVKPMNLLLSSELGQVKVADFGLAFDTDATRMTTTGRTMGTLAFMPPEQILGKRDEIDARADVYALGATLFQLLTLGLPFKGETQQMYINSVLTAEARRPSKLNERVSRDLEVVIGKTLEKNPSDRYASAGEFADDLENVLRFRPILARPPTKPQRVWKWARRKPVHAALAAVLVAGIPTMGVLVQRAVAHRKLTNEQAIARLRGEVNWLNRHQRYLQLLEPAAEVLRLDPNRVPVLQARSFAYLQLALAESDQKRADELERKALDDVERLIHLQPSARWPQQLRAYVLSRFGHEEAASQAAEAAARLPASREYEDLFFEAYLALDRGDYEIAVQLFSESQAMRPDNPDLLAARALAQERRGETDKALQDYRLALALAPDDWTTAFALGNLLRRSGELEEGELFTRRAVDLQPNSAYVYEALSDQHLEAGKLALSQGEPLAALDRFRQAEAAARKSLEIRPDLPWAQVNLGASLMERYRIDRSEGSEIPEEAIAHYRSALDSWRALPHGMADLAFGAALVNTCDALLQSGRAEDAVTTCEEAEAVWSEDAVAAYNLAGAYALAGRVDDALAALERDYELGDRDWEYLLGDRWFQSLQGDPRFHEVVARMQIDGAGD